MNRTKPVVGAGVGRTGEVTFKTVKIGRAEWQMLKSMIDQSPTYARLEDVVNSAVREYLSRYESVTITPVPRKGTDASFSGGSREGRPSKGSAELTARAAG